MTKRDPYDNSVDIEDADPGDGEKSQLMSLPHGGSMIIDPNGYAALVNKDDQAPEYRNHPNDPTDSANDYLDWKHHQQPHQQDLADYKQFMRDNAGLHSTGGEPNYDGTTGAAAGLGAAPRASLPYMNATTQALANQAPPDTMDPGWLDRYMQPGRDVPQDTLGPSWLDEYMKSKPVGRAMRPLNPDEVAANRPRHAMLAYGFDGNDIPQGMLPLPEDHQRAVEDAAQRVIPSAHGSFGDALRNRMYASALPTARDRALRADADERALIMSARDKMLDNQRERPYLHGDQLPVDMRDVGQHPGQQRSVFNSPHLPVDMRNPAPVRSRVTRAEARGAAPPPNASPAAKQDWLDRVVAYLTQKGQGAADGMYDHIASDKRQKTDVIYDAEESARRTDEDKAGYYEDYAASHPGATRAESDADYDTPEAVSAAADAVPRVTGPKSYTDRVDDALNAERDLLKKEPKAKAKKPEPLTGDDVVHHGDEQYDIDKWYDDPTQYRTAPYSKEQEQQAPARSDGENATGSNKKGVTPLYKGEERFPVAENDRQLEKLDQGSGDEDYKTRAANALGNWIPENEAEYDALPESIPDRLKKLKDLQAEKQAEKDRNDLYTGARKNALPDQPTTDQQLADEKRIKENSLNNFYKFEPRPPEKRLDMGLSPEQKANADVAAREQAATAQVYKKEGVAPPAPYKDPYAVGGRPEDSLNDIAKRNQPTPPPIGGSAGVVVSKSAANKDENGLLLPRQTVAHVPAVEHKLIEPGREDRYERAISAQGIPAQMEADAMSAQARAIYQIQQRKALLEGGLAVEQQQAEQERREKMERLQNELKSQSDAITSEKIDPSHFWTSKDNGAKAMTVMALMFGGMLQGLHGGENPAMKMVNDAIDRDIAVQKANIAHRKERLGTTKNQLELYRMQFGDERMAEAAVRLSRLNSLDAFIESEKSHYSDPAFQARAAAVQAQLDVQRQQAGIAANKYVEAHDVLLGNGMGELDDKNRDLYIPQLGAIGFRKEDVQDTVNELGAHGALKGTLAEILKLRRESAQTDPEKRMQLSKAEALASYQLQEFNRMKRLSNTDEGLNQQITGDANKIIWGGGTDANLRSLNNNLDHILHSRVQARGFVGGTHGYDPMTRQLKVYYTGRDYKPKFSQAAPTDSGWLSSGN